LHLSDLAGHALHELLLVSNVGLDGIEKQVAGLLLVLLNLVDLLGEGLSGLGLVDLDAVLVALLDQEVDLALDLVAEFDARRVGQVEGLLVLVQVNPVRGIGVADCFDYLPRVVLWNQNTE
jgi:hypothetical protein